METAPGFPDDIPLPKDLIEIRLQDHFVQWVGMGEGRSFKDLAALMNLPVSEVVGHAHRFKWRERLGVITSRAGQKTMDQMVECVADLNQVHVGELRALRSKALERLKESTIVHDRDAIKLYFEAEKMERQILGLDADSDKNNLADILVERLKKVEARVLPNPEDPSASHEFELEKNLEREPLELPAPEEDEDGDGDGEGDG